MAEKARSVRASGEGVQDTPGSKTAPDSRSPGARSPNDIFHVNDKGEYCVGTSCFSMRFKPGQGEIRVVVDRNECGQDAQQIVDALFGEAVKGVPTVYETVSEVKRKE